MDIAIYIHGCTLAVEGSIIQLGFEDYFEFTLLPKMNRRQRHGITPRSVLVMDNCATYHYERTTQICLVAGIRLLYLPAYLPHLNPIELSFHLLKKWLRRYKNIAPV